MLKKNIPEGILKFLLLVAVTIAVTYRAPKILASIWYLFTLVLYYRSRDEAFWLVFYLVTVDGFIGYFGVYTVTLQVLPDLPAIELAQFYIILTLIKANRIKNQTFIFYSKYLTILLIYLTFLIVWGQMMGFSGELNAYFRVAKLTLPFLLFYSLPRLFTTFESYRRLFTFIFLILIGAFATQLFTLLTGLLPSGILELTAEQISEAGAYRGFFNAGATLMGLFGALFFLTQGDDGSFSKTYLYMVIIAAYGMAYISATRGWILSFSFIIIMSFVLVPGIGPKRIAGFLAVAVVAIYLGLSNNKIREQINFSSTRVETLGAVAKGDVTAEGTLSRISIRGPKVMKIFRENPVFGWGFSDTSRKYSDGHVGNQTLLMHSGMIGFALLTGFLLYFSARLLMSYFKSRRNNLFKKGMPMFVIFLIGWFLIHSSSGQQFNYMGIPGQIMPQAIFFSFGAFIYLKSKGAVHG